MPQRQSCEAPPAALFPLYRPVKLAPADLVGFVPPRSNYELRHDCGCCVQEAVAENAPPKVAFSAKFQTDMTYIEQFEAELTEKLGGSEDTATIVRWVSEKVLEKLPKRHHGRPKRRNRDPQGKEPPAFPATG